MIPYPKFIRRRFGSCAVPLRLGTAPGPTGWWCGLALLCLPPCVAAETPDLAGPPEAPVATPEQAAQAASWLDVSRLPFIPVPEVAVDPDSGVTIGVLPTWLHSSDQHQITRIVAPDLLYNPYFGYGGHFRVFAYPSSDEQWSVVAGAKQRVEREFDAEYQVGRLRDQRWSFQASLIYDRSGTPRFYGIGNDSPAAEESNYTNEQEMAQLQAGLNFSHTWQLLYTARLRHVDVLPGTLNGVADTYQLFPTVVGLGTTNEFLNRIAVVYDTRDDQTLPRHGTQWVIYGGVASRNALPDDSLYSEAGLDARTFVPVNRDTVLAAHVAVRYMPSAEAAPFWALSTLGGDESDIGGEQLLRGFGQGRFCDRNLYSGSLELRRRVLSFDAAASHIDVELTPFIDLGKVFRHPDTSPLSSLHKVAGVGFRGIAPPSVVGYVDIGYGSEGVAVFTGINFPF